MLFKFCLYLQGSCVPHKYLRVWVITSRNQQTLIIHQPHSTQTRSMILGMLYLFALMIIKHERTIFTSHDNHIIPNSYSTKDNLRGLWGNWFSHLKFQLGLSRLFSGHRIERVLLHHVVVTNSHVFVSRFRLRFPCSIVEGEINYIFFLLECLWVRLVFLLKVHLLLFLEAGLIEYFFLFHEEIFGLSKILIFPFEQIVAGKSDILDEGNGRFLELIRN